MKHFSGQASSDRLQIAQHILALARAALQPRKPASGPCGIKGKAIPAMAVTVIRDLPAWTAVNPFRPSDASAGPPSQLVPAHRTADTELKPQAAQVLNAIAITRATPRSCPALRRQLKARGGCRQHIVGRPIPTALKTPQSALHTSNVLSILKARPRHLRELTCWLGEPDPVAAGMRLWGACVPAGWHGLLEQTLSKLLAMARSPARRSALKDLSVFCHGAELGFGLPGDSDAALLGIARRAEATSRWTCSACGSPGRRREIGEEGRATLCARCAAPMLLQWDVWELQQSLRFLRAVNMPVVESQIPHWLRESFRRQAAAHPEDDGPQGRLRIIPARFLAWASEWQLIGERITGGPDWRETNRRPSGMN